MQTNWKQLLWLKAEREPRSSTHQTSSEDPEPKQNPGVLEKDENYWSSQPTEALLSQYFWRNFMQNRITFTDKESAKGSTFHVTDKFTHLLQPIRGTGLSPSTRKMKMNKQKTRLPPFLYDSVEIRIFCSILFLWSDFQTFHLPGKLSPLTDQNMGFKVKFPALQSTQIGSSYFLREVIKWSHILHVDKH